MEDYEIQRELNLLHDKIRNLSAVITENTRRIGQLECDLERSNSRIHELEQKAKERELGLR